MKLSILATLAISATILMGCASVKKPSVEIANHDSDHNIPAIDQMIVEMKQAYIEKCYLPVAHRKPPENACQSELFQTLERRYHLDFNQNHVAMASNDLFFKDIDAELRKMLRSDPIFAVPYQCGSGITIVATRFGSISTLRSPSA